VKQFSFRYSVQILHTGIYAEVCNSDIYHYNSWILWLVYFTSLCELQI